MVYTPRKYLIPAVIALVAMQMQQAAATSLYYTAETTSGTTDEISGKFPARGGEVADQDCEFTIEVDPTLPDITTILMVPVTFTDLLANTTTAPIQPVSTKVGTPVVQEDSPSDNQDQDAYTNQGSNQGSTTQSMTPAAPAAKTGTTVQGNANSKDPNCATGWEEPSITNKLQEKRRLEVNTNKDIAKLEAYFGTPMEKTLKNLPTSGVHTPSPWPAPYWPTYQDGINVVWSQGEPSPAENVGTVFTGARFNGGTDSKDDNGRHSNAAYRDLNPAYFHIAAANMLGSLNATFVVDVTAGSEVWNQPVRG
ncbi:hypothetical protein JM18_009652, partial [Phytophthora kernoviae]